MKLKIKSPPKITNKEGKATRQSAKPILIGSIYQRGTASIAEQIHKSIEETQIIMDKFYAGFPIITKWMKDSKQFTLKNGYMDNAVGRRRRLPNALLPNYSLELKDPNNATNFNPLLGCENKVADSLINKYATKLNNIKSKRDYNTISYEASLDGLKIINNNGKIQQCLRQCVNFQAQSLGADIIKKAMIKIEDDKKLKELGFELLLSIHDELLGECPEENAEICAKRLTELMLSVPKELNINVPMSADNYIVTSFYEDEITTALNNKYDKLTKGDSKKNIPPISSEEAYSKICEEWEELTPESIYKVIHQGEQLKI